MNNSNSHYYAWIPALTNGISIEKGFETILEKYKEESSHTYTSKKPHIEKDIKNKKGREFDIKIILDADKKVKMVQFLIPNSNRIICGGDIGFFQNSHHTLTGLIEIYNTMIDKGYIEECVKNMEEDKNIKGLEKEKNHIKIDKDYIKKGFEKKKIREIYTCVRDIYHKHTHHDDSHDLHLDVVDASNTKDAIEKIIKQYEDKVNKHILRIKDIYQNFKNKKSLSETGWYDKFILAIGEMIYAQRFIELHEDELPPGGKEYLISQFKHGEKTLNTLKEMINEEIESQRKEEILKLTFIGTMIGVVGAIIGIILSLDALHNLGVSWLITLIIMLVISILIVLTLGILLIKPIESRILKLLEKI